ncbi:hypothetical protein KP509_38G004700 [Ceratopteris richardii]|uniref:RING-type E3 ubiquitin transferase n=1 Tax=Ceratopteris richardii TaxID=49495 RepID=A0A8T2Q1V8_CERRI|nr:hypothetical protein KP509_38G004700 [Ceratopteris richardii]KAH7277735.1 hypothetical protein KP509_38G004700 [Ceratopteris richardii]KAH7277736.1 hypothetical protein KP509_38G004700 [Ceratopteris richardii]
MATRSLLNSPSAPVSAQVSPSIIVIIVVLTVIFFFSAFLHLLIRWLARHPELVRRGVRGHVIMDVGPNNSNIIALTALQGQLHQLFSMQDTGLQRSLVEALPVFPYKAAMDAFKEGADCAICLCEFEEEDVLRLLPSCGHAFHTECIDTWLFSHSTCPLCRMIVLADCWIPNSLHLQLLSNAPTRSAVADVEHQRQTGDTVEFAQSSSGAMNGTSSGRSSLGHRIPNASELEKGATSNLITGSSRRTCASAIFQSSENGQSDRLSNCAQRTTLVKEDDGTTPLMKTTPLEARNHIRFASCGSSVSSSAGADSKSLSYVSYCNITESHSGRYSDRSDHASTNTSRRLISLHLGKCGFVESHEHPYGPCVSGISDGRGLRIKSYSKGSYEYVIRKSTNLEFPVSPSPSKVASSSADSSRFCDLLSLNNHVSSSATGNPASGHFGLIRLCHRSDLASRAKDLIHQKNFCTSQRSGTAERREHRAAAPLNCSLSNEKSSSSDYRALNVINELGAAVHCTSESGNHCRVKLADSSGLVSSCLLPAGPSQRHELATRLRSRATRRSLSESEALSFWEPKLSGTADIEMQNPDTRLDNDPPQMILGGVSTGSDWPTGLP